MEKPKILVHICCAICAVALIEKLKENFEPVLFYYNPNIYPEDEYEKRRQSVKKMAEIYGIELIDGNYDPEIWQKRTRGKEQEPERGARCHDCFELRLQKTAKLAKERGINIFTTSLFVSPFKDEKQVDEAGKNVAEAENIKYLEMGEILEDKSENWKKTRELAKKYNFYFQKYCGCVFSAR
ncbi:MAG TPA: epoxyqueuosine reductase QueH [Candidatus Staskawiczbacteria bacterium]|nr:epoxyqueuosine reductase QueH [Candidatus Staskawiczbacteria bacterium]